MKQKKVKPAKKPKKGQRKPPAEQRHAGRPTALDDTLLREILETAKTSPFARIAAEKHGIPVSTFRDWLSRGREDEETARDTIWARLSSGWRMNTATWANDRMARLIEADQNGDVGTSRWLLSRFDPELFGDRVKVGGELDLKHRVALPDEALADPTVQDALATLVRKAKYDDSG